MGTLDLEDTTIRQALEETLQSEEKFELFIKWMHREFSGEAALCFIEIVQFKKCVIKYIKKNNKEVYKQQKFDMHYIDLLYKTVPRSTIVYETDSSSKVGVGKWAKIANVLYEKYIRVNSQFEVNISHGLRKKYEMKNDEWWVMELEELAIVFDKLIEEMVFFMRQSFIRFKDNTAESAQKLSM